MKLIKKISLLTLLLTLNAQAKSIFVAEKDIPVHNMGQTIKYLNRESYQTVYHLEQVRDELMQYEMADAKQQKARCIVLEIIRHRINLLRQGENGHFQSSFDKIWYNYIPFTKSTEKDLNREWLKLYEITQDPKNVKSMLNRTFENFPWKQMYETY